MNFENLYDEIITKYCSSKARVYTKNYFLKKLKLVLPLNYFYVFHKNTKIFKGCYKYLSQGYFIVQFFQSSYAKSYRNNTFLPTVIILFNPTTNDFNYVYTEVSNNSYKFELKKI